MIYSNRFMEEFDDALDEPPNNQQKKGIKLEVLMDDQNHLHGYGWKLKEKNTKKNKNKEFKKKKVSFVSKKRQQIHKKADEYLDSVTLHGFTRVFKGHPIEAVFWLIIILIGSGLITLVIYNLVHKFQSREMYIHSQIELTDTNHLPAVTFCYKRISKKMFCGNHINDDVPEKVLSPHPCIHNQEQWFPSTAKSSGSACAGSKIWQNDIFKFEFKNICDGKGFLAFKQTSESCVTWNFDGDIYSESEIEFSIKLNNLLKKKQFEIEAIVHDPNIYGPVQENIILMSSNNHYDIPIEKTIHKRLKAPFKTNCTNEKSYDLFPKDYSRIGCLDSMKCLETFKECGDTFDFCYFSIPKLIRQAYKSNVTNIEAKACILKHYKKTFHENCPQSCQDITYRKYPSTYKTNEDNENELFFRMKYVEPSSYEIIEERELYSIDQLFCESGGLVGVVLGGSVLSIIEIIIYLVLILIKRCV